VPQTAVAEARVSEKRTHLGQFARRRWVILGAGVFALGAVVYCAVLALNWPFKKQAIVDVLEERSARHVVIDRFSRTYFPPGCVAERIKFLRSIHKEREPLISVDKVVMTITYSRILMLQRRLTLVRVLNMHITVPPSEPGKPNPIMPLTYSADRGQSIVVDKTIADGAVLDFLSNEPGEKPFRLLIDKLRVDGIGNNQPMFYRMIISNQMPPGKIQSTGVFGTWNPRDPGSTPLHGTYRFDNANLLSFGGISGTLFSTGKFSGTLSHVNVDGTTDIPNFKVRDTSHTRRLTAEFKAVIDAIKGDTLLNEVNAHFDRTTVKFKGSVADQGGKSGKTASLDMTEGNGRIEDLLDLFISAKVPPMTGNVSFKGHIDLPPGPEKLFVRMRLEGDFGVGAGKFTNKQTEADVTHLSDSAEKKHGGEAGTAATVLSDLKGHAVATGGVARLSHLSFTIPGARAWLDGTYNLLNYKVDLHGTLLTTGQPGDATTGIKSFFVKAMSPFFKKRDSVKIVPIKMTGTYQNPKLSLDLLAKKKQ
jgi:hypothetical protein